MNQNTGAATQLNITAPTPTGSQSLPARKRGGQPGNRNARKHGLYARYLSPKQLEDYNEACGVRGVEAELDLFRCKLAEMLETEPWNLALLNRITNTILRLEASLPLEPEEREPTQRALNIMGPFFSHLLAKGDEEVTRAFDKWMENNQGRGLVSENVHCGESEADSR
ncbi:hypothetical protein [Dehalogenimonas formicexedens]|nr:hypothetical protein [Dehalogenimonas formicexedens]